VVIAAAMALGGGVSAASAAQGQSAGHALLDVPYVTQTPELCGGAAVAMVMRYWGERQIFAEDFSALVVPSERGIPTGALAAAVRDRAWQAVVLPVASDNGRTRIRAEVDQGRPLIALIEVGPRTYHFIVIVGATADLVVLHDPARAPFRVLPWAEFDRAWAVANRWLMLVLPPEGGRPASPIPAARPETPGTEPPLTPCAALVARGVELARTGDPAASEQALEAATAMCPTNPDAWQELAGLRFSQSRWAESARLSSVAVRLAPGSDYARRLLGTTRYLIGDEAGALAAWTPLGEPRIDAITVQGAERTRHPVVVRATGLQPRQLLTAEVFGRARRRLDALPVASRARLQYEPLDAGLAKVDAVISERSVLPRGWVPLATIGVRAAVSSEVRLDVAGALGAGELTSVAWRWKSARPRVSVTLGVPSPHWIPGIVSVTGLWERQSYQVSSAPGAAPLIESRRRAGVSLADWATSHIRWHGGIAMDRFDSRAHLAVDAGLDVRLAADHIALGLVGGGWFPLSDGDHFTSGRARAAWRSTMEPNAPSWTGIVALSSAGPAAPLALWEGAGPGHSRSGLLRAHRLLQDDVVTGEAFGRTFAYGTTEYARPVGRVMNGSVAVAGFVDLGRAWHRLDGSHRSPLFVDAGAGLRISAVGRSEVLRVDVAHGIRGGGTRLSFTWGRAWPW
jgi:hypothetical protein